MGLSPTITFQVNLETIGTPGWLQPSSTILDGNETVTEASNVKYTRTIWLPGLKLANYEGVGPSPTDDSYVPGYLHHGQQFTVSGLQATYLKNTYCPGTINDVLIVVSIM